MELGNRNLICGSEKIYFICAWTFRWHPKIYC